jgi:nitrite reductase/ring-hydroxylating ferredoxin subunit
VLASGDDLRGLPTAADASESEINRRSFISRSAGLAMAAGLIGSYGTFAGLALRYLFPSRPRDREWLLVAPLSQIATGRAIPFIAPDGQKIAIARQGDGDRVEDFVALGSTCPHLGCQVHWEPHNSRFFCPCHNGVFDPSGKGIGGPPGDAGQNLPKFPLKVERGLLYIEVPMDSLPRPV